MLVASETCTVKTQILWPDNGGKLKLKGKNDMSATPFSWLSQCFYLLIMIGEKKEDMNNRPLTGTYANGQ